eukprot:NODE_2531_length_1176_cov_28.015084_g2312_i0.p1 GENE.NODE_2531_length_1176_cov_28.015084_g2312_i0~~NODE_2531_length_1176_cov_28.015084_g2312_i0.p1  ORF type:complete len:316 (-),score=60.30 NODE_2531_length_1176_cov_28.015084_g2312_i0:228-1049(-)
MSETKQKSLGFNLTDRVAIVTGGTSGIGLAIAHALLDHGCKVLVGSSTAAKVSSAQEELAKDRAAGVVTATLMDMIDPAAFDLALDLTVKTYGRVDILVNCAGVNQKKPTLDVTPEELSRIMTINFTSPFHACQSFARQVMKQGREIGQQPYSIVNICSITSFQGMSEVTAYACSKSALLGLTRQLAVEWPMKYGIRVTGVAPGVVVADQNRKILSTGDRGKRIKMTTPAERFGTAEVPYIGNQELSPTTFSDFVSVCVRAVPRGSSRHFVAS